MNYKKAKGAKINTTKRSLLSEGELDPRNVKERITIFIDQDILDHFRLTAKKSKKKYQTLINDALREVSAKPSLEERVEALESKLKKVAG